MILNDKKLIGWLAALALPLLGFGQEIIRDPQNATVCVGESAVFISEMTGGVTSWYFDDVLRIDLSPEIHGKIEMYSRNTISGSRIETIIVNYDEMLNGLKVKSTVGEFGGLSANSTIAHLFYQTNQQFPATGLIGAVNNGTAQIYWNELKSEFNLTTEYLIGMYDNNDNLVANQTTDVTHASFELPPRANNTCQLLKFRVTANQCPDPASGFIQTEGTTFVYTRPDVSPVTAEFDNYQTVLVSWTPDGGNAFQIVVTDLVSGNQTAYNSTQPFSYMAAGCGQFNLNVSVSPAECPDQPGITQSETIRFTIPCPTTPTEPETEVIGESSGTLAMYPSLLAVVAVIPLLKWQH